MATFRQQYLVSYTSSHIGNNSSDSISPHNNFSRTQIKYFLPNTENILLVALMDKYFRERSQDPNVLHVIAPA